MDHRFLALIAALCFSGSAAAGFAQTTPPAGWSAGGGAGGSITGTRAAVNGAVFTTDTVRTNVSLNLGGRAVTMPASARFSANAARIAAGAVMLHPGIRTAASIATWLGVAGLVYDAASGLWQAPSVGTPVSDGYDYRATLRGVTVIGISVSDACSRLAVGLSASVDQIIGTACYLKFSSSSYDFTSVSRVASSCPVGWYVTAGGCVQTPPPRTLTHEDAVRELESRPMPADVPQHIPEPLPIEIPQIQPTFIPTGDPVTNPKFDPSQAPSESNPPQIQPGVEARPAPTASNPWQVSLNPVNKPITDTAATPERNPTPIPDGSGSGTTPPNEPQENADFCARNPTVLACQTLEHEDDDTKLPTKAIEFEFEPYNGFSGVKSCPAFPTTTHILNGEQVTWEPFCKTLDKLSHLLLAFAWVSAAFIILGYGRD